MPPAAGMLEQLVAWGRSWEGPGEQHEARAPSLQPHAGRAQGRSSLWSPIAMTVKKEGMGVLCSGTPSRVQCRERRAPASVVSGVIWYQTASARQEPATSLHKHPGLQQCNFRASSVYKPQPGATPYNTLLLGHDLSPGAGASLRRALGTALPSDQQKQAAFHPGGMPARDAGLLQEMWFVPLVTAAPCSVCLPPCLQASASRCGVTELSCPSWGPAILGQCVGCQTSPHLHS